MASCYASPGLAGAYPTFYAEQPFTSSTGYLASSPCVGPTLAPSTYVIDPPATAPLSEGIAWAPRHPDIIPVPLQQQQTAWSRPSTTMASAFSPTPQAAPSPTLSASGPGAARRIGKVVYGVAATTANQTGSAVPATPATTTSSSVPEYPYRPSANYPAARETLRYSDADDTERQLIGMFPKLSSALVMQVWQSLPEGPGRIEKAIDRLSYIQDGDSSTGFPSSGYNQRTSWEAPPAPSRVEPGPEYVPRPDGAAPRLRTGRRTYGYTHPSSYEISTVTNAPVGGMAKQGCEPRPLEREREQKPVLSFRPFYSAPTLTTVQPKPIAPKPVAAKKSNKTVMMAAGGAVALILLVFLVKLLRPLLFGTGGGSEHMICGSVKTASDCDLLGCIYNVNSGQCYLPKPEVLTRSKGFSYPYKLLVIGDNQVGKTTLVNSFLTTFGSLDRIPLKGYASRSEQFRRTAMQQVELYDTPALDLRADNSDTGFVLRRFMNGVRLGEDLNRDWTTWASDRSNAINRVVIVLDARRGLDRGWLYSTVNANMVEQWRAFYDRFGSLGAPAPIVVLNTFGVGVGTVQKLERELAKVMPARYIFTLNAQKIKPLELSKFLFAVMHDSRLLPLQAGGYHTSSRYSFIEPLSRLWKKDI